MDESPRAVSPQPGLPPTRRNFSAIAIHGIWAVIVAALGLPAIGYLLIPAKFRRKSDFVEAGDISQLSPQVPLEIAFRRNRVDGWRVVSEKSTAWVVKSADNKVTAFGPQCEACALLFAPNGQTKRNWPSSTATRDWVCHSQVLRIPPWKNM